MWTCNQPAKKRYICQGIRWEEEGKSHLSTIRGYLNIKYNLGDEIDASKLRLAQFESLYSEIKKKFNHQKLYKVRENDMASIKESSLWLTHGNNTFCDLAATIEVYIQSKASLLITGRDRKESLLVL
ncbi:hypothetical protein GINT2_000579 [Glugoides intestinalis]